MDSVPASCAKEDDGGIESHLSVMPPKNLYFSLTSECNLHCKHCHMWLNQDKPGALTALERANMIKSFAKMNPKGSVILSGGEVMLKEDEFFLLTTLCKDLGLNSIAISNASLIQPRHYERILSEGPNVFFISLDSHEESVHDHIRGTPGAWRHVIKVIKDLVALKKERPDASVKLYTITVIFEKNIHDIKNTLAYIKALGVDGVLVQALSETTQNKSPSGQDPFFRENFFKNREMAVQAIDDVVSEFGSGNFLVNKIEYEWLKKYILNGPAYETEDLICGSGERSIYVDYDGSYLLCSNMNVLKGIPPLGSSRSIPIQDLWVSTEADNARKVMRQCRKYCGMYSCNRKD